MFGHYLILTGNNIATSSIVESWWFACYLEPDPHVKELTIQLYNSRAFFRIQFRRGGANQHFREPTGYWIH